jgi:hypothetical protein
MSTNTINSLDVFKFQRLCGLHNDFRNGARDKLSPTEASDILNFTRFHGTWCEKDYVESDHLDEFENLGDDDVRLGEVGGRLDSDKLNAVKKYKEQLDELVLLRNKQLEISYKLFNEKRVSERLLNNDREKLECLEQRQAKINEFLKVVSSS